MQIVYSRSSTATQSLLRQRHILTEAGLLVRSEGAAEGFHPAPGVLLFEDPATTSKIPALERPAFAKVATAANPGDALTVSELFRLCRDLVGIHQVRAWCLARGVALRVLSGPLPNFTDLAAKDATTDLLINVSTAVGQFQRDLQNELTDEGIAAAEAEGRPVPGPPARLDRRSARRRPRRLPQPGRLDRRPGPQARSKPSGRAQRAAWPAPRPECPARSVGMMERT
ncbi:recombinase family protein [Actinomadura macra]|uniref:recombinase family protein n=1 Tax=Actinomadura macra TaxID=46164 RepID=UPI00082E941B|nr:recombinase family protein [Actinomadura macra]